MEDNKIVKRVLDGEREAYGELVRKHQNMVFRFCMSMLSDATQAEDAAQEIFIKAYKSLEQFHGTSQFSTWLYRIASNYCTDLLRKKSREKSESWEALIEQEGEKIHQLLAQAPESSVSPEQAELIDRVLAQLSPEHRTVLTLREIDGLTYQEIAEALHCSLDAVKGRLKRAREDFEKKMRHFLGSVNV